MTLGQLFELQANGALKIKHDENEAFATLGENTKISVEQAEQLCGQLGWLEHYLSAFETIAKTNSIVSTLRKSAIGTNWTTEMLNTTTVEFQNRRATTYGKTFDRIVLYVRGYKYTIIHGMEHVGGAYVVYVNGSSIPSAKCRTLNKVAEYLVGVV